MSLLKIQNLSVRFPNGVAAVDNISFDIGENEIVGIVGESGSGKTITGYSIMRILPKEAEAISGVINFQGKDLLKIPENEMCNIRGKEIGIVFQEPFTSLNPVLRIGDQAEETLITHKKISKKEAESVSLEFLKKLKIKDPQRIYSSFPHQLSGGQRQRIMIAIATVLNPKLLIADEPTTALDVTVQNEILKLLKDLKDNLNLSILFITHDFSIIERLADRVIVMKDGKIVERGTKHEVLTAPKHEYTRKLIGAVPRKVSERRRVRDEGRGTIDDGRVLIETKNLNKSFDIEKGMFKTKVGKVHAVKDLNIKIEKGKIIGLVGESGCGKSTLGRLLLGLEKPDSGEIIVSDKGSMAQIVFQDPMSSLDPRMTLRDIVLEGPRISKIKRSDQENLLKELLPKVQLSYGDRFKYPHQFSGGERQRIAIARALAVRPQFIVLDEPVSSLDVLIQKDVLELLKGLKREMNLTYLFISHDLRIVDYFSDYVYVMRSGEMVGG